MLRLRKKTNTGATQYYNNAMMDCDTYFITVKQDGQDYGAKLKSAEMARHAFKEKHSKQGTGYKMPSSYICSERDAQEFFWLYKRFLHVYQSYLAGGFPNEVLCDE